MYGGPKLSLIIQSCLYIIKRPCDAHVVFFVMTTLTVDRYLNHNGAQVPQIGYVGTYCRPMVTSNSATTNREKGLSAQVILHHKQIARYNFVFFIG